MEEKRKVICGIVQTTRKLQPLNVYKRGKIVRFATTQKEAEAALASGGQ